MKIFKFVLAVLLCATLFCGCQVKRGEEKFQQAYDAIKTGEEGSSYAEIQNMLGDGEWRPSAGRNTTLYWQNGTMMISVTFDERAKAQLKNKNW